MENPGPAGRSTGSNSDSAFLECAVYEATLTVCDMSVIAPRSAVQTAPYRDISAMLLSHGKVVFSRCHSQALDRAPDSRLFVSPPLLILYRLPSFSFVSLRSLFCRTLFYLLKEQRNVSVVSVELGGEKRSLLTD